MNSLLTRRSFLVQSASLAAALTTRPAAAAKRPQDYIVVEGHRDIWELTDRFKIRDRKQHTPMRDFLVPRLIEGGVSVVIMPVLRQARAVSITNKPIVGTESISPHTLRRSLAMGLL